MIKTNPPQKRTVTFQVTDPGLGHSLGNELAEPERGLHPGLKLVRFGPNVPELAGQAPNINRNAYNFVAFGGADPWLEPPNHPDHSAWSPGYHSGILELDMTLFTPIFIPEGFPFQASNREDESRYLGIHRHFFRLPDVSGQVRYAIPGASLKGVLRSAIEALTNSRCGELNEKSTLARFHIGDEFSRTQGF